MPAMTSRFAPWRYRNRTRMLAAIIGLRGLASSLAKLGHSFRHLYFFPGQRPSIVQLVKNVRRVAGIAGKVGDHPAANMLVGRLVIPCVKCLPIQGSSFGGTNRTTGSEFGRISFTTQHLDCEFDAVQYFLTMPGDCLVNALPFEIVHILCGSPDFVFLFNLSFAVANSFPERNWGVTYSTSQPLLAARWSFSGSRSPR